ncbi:ABC transporter ATP-binding protein [Pelagibius sp.]|uniref:ABC transporter ATP-binding protein n=1 Tax=Pelagibius sp. TaxID=1931238 RepID=UPI002631A42D|nr:ABC transporter ATP-binding protein [Pelagibius sp.]
MARIELDNITKAWGDVVAVEPTDLTIDDGEFVAILGPSGCGKSTTLFMLAGIYAPTGGEMKFDGHVVNEVEAKDRNVGIVFQSYALYPHMTVRENILFPLKFKDIPAGRAPEMVEETARLVQVEEFLERRPSQLSGGQQQRVALARALVKSPQLLLLDEPLSNLDATLRLSMRTEIRALQRRTGVTTILVTHDQIEATTMADRIICMSRGRVEQIGAPEDLYRRPNSLFVASFIGAPPINTLSGNATGNAVSLGDSVLALLGEARGVVTVGLRPEHLQFADQGLPGRIDGIEPMGREILYLVKTPLGDLRVLEAGSVPRRSAEQEVRLHFAPEDTLVFDGASEDRLPDVHAALAEETKKRA